MSSFTPIVGHVDELVDAGALLEGARAEEVAIGRIERDGLVAAALQRLRQSARDAAGGDPRDVEFQIAERARRQAGQHVELGVPGRAAGRLRDHGALLAVARLEIIGVAGRHLDAGRRGDVEARLVEQHDDVRPLGRRVAGLADGSAGRTAACASRARLQRAVRRRIGLDPSGRSQPRHRHHARARQVGNVIDALERLPCLLGRSDRHRRDQRGRRRHAAPARSGGARGTDRSARAPTAAEPQRAPPAINCICSRGNTESRNENVSRSMIRKSRKVSVSCRMSELEVRQRDQDHDQDQRQRGADAGPLQHGQQEAVHEDPRQHATA